MNKSKLSDRLPLLEEMGNKNRVRGKRRINEDAETEIANFASAYKANVTKIDLEELIQAIGNKEGEDAREIFKNYFNIPVDADEDPDYMRDKNYDSKNFGK